MKPKSFLVAALFLNLAAVIARGGTISFDYDAAGRLTAAKFTNNLSVVYAYDSAGNLLQRQFSLTADADSDGDGMDDAWERQYFGDLSRNGAGDFDNDGFRDLHEFVAGTVPNDSNSALKLFREVVVNSAVTVQWQSVAGKTYRLQFKDALNHGWTDLPDTITATGSTTEGTNTPPAGQNTRFYRVIIEP